MASNEWLSMALPGCHSSGPGWLPFQKPSRIYLLQFFVDHYLNVSDAVYPSFLSPLGFVGLAVLQGLFTFLSGIFAAEDR